MLKRQAEALLHALQQLHPDLKARVSRTYATKDATSAWYVHVYGGSVDY